MKYTILTLFPQLVRPWTDEALLGRAAARGLLDFDLRDLREQATGKHRSVDDTPYGGGAGMVIRVDIAARAIDEVRHSEPPPDEIILLSPAGEPFTQPLAEELARKQHLCLLAGRYEGFDARTESYVTREISIGDYVLMGGEVAALALIEATARLIPGVLGDAESHAQDSFSSRLLDYPEYTRPQVYRDEAIPDVLLSGHHANIASWRRQQALERTYRRRPDLLEHANLSEEDRAFLASLSSSSES
ncbi:MAG: tRNA (guanosine(37)-N1)-methyltransferase TrmD [Trueperaceae bacterium]|nr:tRNA (guanosine(37)-N1)-methyltransferase TrmD [Trueperaceae bacterium]